MMADIRMLQEQNQQLQVTLGTLVDALKAVAARIDQQAETTRKAGADQKLLIDGVANEMRIVREKIDDTNVRLGSLSQEVDALRNSMPATPRRRLPRRRRTARPLRRRPIRPARAPAPTHRQAPPAPAGRRPRPGCRRSSSGSRLLRLRRRPMGARHPGLRDLPARVPEERAVGRCAALHRRGAAARWQVQGSDRGVRQGDHRLSAGRPGARCVLQARRDVQSAEAERSRPRVVRSSHQEFPDSEASRLAKQMLDRLGRGAARR